MREGWDNEPMQDLWQGGGACIRVLFLFFLQDWGMMKSESAHLNGDSHTHVLSRSQNIIKTDLRPVDLAD